MNETIHPGLYIREQIIPASMPVKEAAKLLGVGRPALSNLLNGNAALSPEMAARLEYDLSKIGHCVGGRQLAELRWCSPT